MDVDRQDDSSAGIYNSLLFDYYNEIIYFVCKGISVAVEVVHDDHNLKTAKGVRLQQINRLANKMGNNVDSNVHVIVNVDHHVDVAVTPSQSPGSLSRYRLIDFNFFLVEVSKIVVFLGSWWCWAYKTWSKSKFWWILWN